MIGLTVSQLLLMTTCFLAFAYGAFQTEGKYKEKLLLMLVGLAFILIAFMVDYIATALGLVPSRPFLSIVLFRDAPLRDILIPIAYSLFAVGLGSFLRQFATDVLTRRRSGGT
jgi:hypothetical protein